MLQDDGVVVSIPNSTLLSASKSCGAIPRAHLQGYVRMLSVTQREPFAVIRVMPRTKKSSAVAGERSAAAAGQAS